MAPVGHVRIRADQARGESLRAEFARWLAEAGWAGRTTVSCEKAAGEPEIEFLPGEYQSNGPRRVSLGAATTFADLAEPLRRWLHEIER